MSYIIGFFAVLLKFIAFFAALLLPAYLIATLLKAVHLRAVGVLAFVAFLGLTVYVSGMQNLIALVLCIVLVIAWIACIGQIHKIPKAYFEMESVKSTADLAWACLYAFGVGALVATIPAIEEALPWQIEGFMWYVYVCLALYALMPILTINSTLEDIDKLKKILNGRTQINEGDFFELVDALTKEDDSEDDAKKKAAFIEEYLSFCGVTVAPSDMQPMEAAAPKPDPSAAPVSVTIEPIDINRADEHAFGALPHFGFALAKKAVQRRQQLGGYRSVDDFYSQLNLSPHVIAGITPYLQCEAIQAQPESKGRKIEF